jgi:hypothetical protein
MAAGTNSTDGLPETAASSLARWSVAVRRVEDLRRATEAGVVAEAERGWRARLAEGQPVHFDRLYGGDEFCQQLIPTDKEFEAFRALADARAVPLTLATPPVTDDGIAAVQRILRPLAQRAESEVLVNDWGTLRLVRREFPDLACVLGRTLHRSLKDPRAQRRSAGPLGDALGDFLAKLGVSMVSMDGLPEGGIAASLAVHLPYEFVTSGRACAISGVSFPPPRKFLVDFVCPKPCREFHLELFAETIPTRMRQVGNTLFRFNGGGDLVSRGAARVDRWVYDLSVDGDFLGLAAVERGA